MTLRLYKKFRKRFSLDSCDGSALGAHHPMILNSMLENLERIGRKGAIDGWMDHIDPQLTYYENKTRLLDKTGLSGFDNPIKGDREEWIKRMEAEWEDRKRQHEEAQEPRNIEGRWREPSELVDDPDYDLPLTASEASEYFNG